MKLFRIAIMVCMQNIRKWRTNYRVWVIAILAFIFVQSFTKEIKYFAMEINMDVSPWIFPFLYSERYIKMLFFFPIILLFCDAPFMDENQAYVILRSKRTAYNLGQILYIIIASSAYFIYLILISIIVNITKMTFTLEWGKVLGTLANTNARQVMGLSVGISKHVINNFTPLQAMWFSFLLCLLCSIFLGLLIYVINIISNTRILGVFTSSFLLIFSAAVYRRPIVQWFSPLSWTSLDFIDIGRTTSYPTYTYIMCMYLGMILVLSILAVVINKRKTISVLPEI